MLHDILQAILAITALLLPWVALYLGVGILLGPLLLRIADRVYGVKIDYLRDTPIAIVAWLGVAGRIAFYEIYEAR